MRPVIIGGLLAIFAIVSFGQSTARIEGKLIQRSGFPLPNLYFKNLDDIKATYQKVSVTLLIRPDNRKVAEIKTNDDGEFVFENIAPGDYLLVVECGYCIRGQINQELRVVAGPVMKVEIELPRTGIFENVTVSAGEGQFIEQVSKT